jgi:hypothetical protein
MSTLCDAATFTHRNTTETANRRQARMAGAIHVLSVGPVECGSMVHDALLNEPNFHLSIATDYRGVWKTPTDESIQVAILHNTLSDFEMEACCRLIRRRWLHARILVVSIEESHLEDALYDDRVAPNASPEALFAAIGEHSGWMHA